MCVFDLSVYVCMCACACAYACEVLDDVVQKHAYCLPFFFCAYQGLLLGICIASLQLTMCILMVGRTPCRAWRITSSSSTCKLSSLQALLLPLSLGKQEVWTDLGGLANKQLKLEQKKAPVCIIFSSF